MFSVEQCFHVQYFCKVPVSVVENVAEVFVERIRLQRCAIKEQHAEEWQFADYMLNGGHKLSTTTCIPSRDVTVQRARAES
jgi:hypothetical protein